MPSFHMKDETPEGQTREKLIDEILPKEPVTIPIDNSKLPTSTKKKALESLKAELEIYRAFPKTGTYNLDTFTPRNSRNCFMGQGFQANGTGFEGWTDWDLTRYRKAVGVIPHETWGRATLLEIWAADHFEKYPAMVKLAFQYGWQKIDVIPKLSFHINPFVKNGKSGTWDPDPEEVFQKQQREHLIKIANYCEIRDRMKKAKVKNPMELAVLEEDDPKPRIKSKTR